MKWWDKLKSSYYDMFEDESSNGYAEDDSEEEWYTMNPQERVKQIAKQKQERQPFYKGDNTKPWE